MMLLFTAVSLALLQSGLSQPKECTPQVLADTNRCAMQAFDKIMPSKEEAIQLVADVVSCLEPSGCTLTEEMQSEAAAFETQKECAKEAMKGLVMPKMKTCLVAKKPELADIPLPDTDRIMDFAFILKSAQNQKKIQKQLMDSCGSKENVDGLFQCILDKSPIKDMVRALLKDSQSDFLKTKLTIFKDLGQCFKAGTPSCVKLLIEIGGVLCDCIDSELMSEGEPLEEVASAFENCGMKADENALLGGIQKLCSLRKLIPRLPPTL